jgi:hypothetical protein
MRTNFVLELHDEWSEFADERIGLNRCVGAGLETEDSSRKRRLSFYLSFARAVRACSFVGSSESALS